MRKSSQSFSCWQLGRDSLGRRVVGQTTRSARTCRSRRRPRMAVPCSKTAVKRRRLSKSCGTTDITGCGCGFSIRPRSWPTIWNTRLRSRNPLRNLAFVFCSTTTTRTRGPIPGSSSCPRRGKAFLTLSLSTRCSNTQCKRWRRSGMPLPFAFVALGISQPFPDHAAARRTRCQVRPEEPAPVPGVPLVSEDARVMMDRLQLPFTVHHHAHRRRWQRRFYDFNVWSERKIREKLDYMHNNPVERRLVERPGDWPWSSWRFYYLQDPRFSPWTGCRCRKDGKNTPSGSIAETLSSFGSQ